MTHQQADGASIELGVGVEDPATRSGVDPAHYCENSPQATLSAGTLHVMALVGVRRLPVFEDSEIAGVVTCDDLMVWLVLELGAVTTPVVGELIRATTDQTFR